jgi:hypothetical protein
VAFFPEPATSQDRFLIQGYVDRDEIAAAVEALVELLDTIDGDPDLEEDDPQGECSEDEINTMLSARFAIGAGCTISDTGIADDGGLYEAHGCDGP